MKNYNKGFNDIRQIKRLISIYKKERNWVKVEELRHRLNIAIKRAKSYR